MSARDSMRLWLTFAFPWVLACAGAPPPAPAAPERASPEARAEAEPAPSRRVVRPAPVPPPPAECASFVARPTSGCTPSGNPRPALARALGGNRSADERDAALACLEAHAELPPGLVRALRAELAPPACADALAEPLLEKPPAGIPLEIEHTLFGLSLSARLSRLLGKPPELAPPFSKQRFLEFQRDELGPWVVAQALAIDELALQGSKLSGYGRAIAAIAAGNADLRFVELARAVPLPEEIRSDQELVDVYYGSLDQALEPRKRRGRDAALVGLRGFAELGAIRDPRVAEARALLSRLWSGSRVDALDELIVPALPAPSNGAPELALAASLPTFYAKHVLAGVDLTSPKLLRAFAERGVPSELLARLDEQKLGSEARRLLAASFVESGRVYFQAASFRRARELLGPGRLDEAARLLAGLARALEGGPADTVALMLKGPAIQGWFDVTELDALAKERGPQAGAAAFDAATIVALAPKPDDADFWEALAARFENAEKLLSPANAAAAERARKNAEAARATARTLRQKS